MYHGVSAVYPILLVGNGNSIWVGRLVAISDVNETIPSDTNTNY